MNQSNPLLRPLQRARRSQSSMSRKLFLCFSVCIILIVCAIIANGLTSIVINSFDVNLREKQTKALSTSDPIQVSTQKTKNIAGAANCGKRIVGYFHQWEFNEIPYNQLSKITHAIYGTMPFDLDGNVYFDFSQVLENFHDVINHARKYNLDVKLIASFGGTNYTVDFPSMLERNIKNFIESTIAFIKEYKIDGVNIQWEHPYNDGSSKDHFTNLVKELRAKLTELQVSEKRQTPYILSVYTPGNGPELEEGVDLEGLSKYVDFFNVALDDYSVYWNSTVGNYTRPHSPLYSGSKERQNQDLNWTMKYYVCKTGKPSMINMGLPFFGSRWKNVLNAIDYTQLIWREVKAINGIIEMSSVSWKDVKKSLIPEEFWWDDKSKSSYIWKPDEKLLIAIDNERSLIEKMKYVKRKNLGGVMIWTVDMDDPSNTLLNSVASVDLCEGANIDKDEIKHNCE